MKVQIDGESSLLSEAKKRECEIVHLTEQALADVEPLLNRIPSKIYLQWGMPQTPFARYDADMDVVEIRMFPNFFDKKWGNGTAEERDVSLRTQLNHELLESIKHSPADSNLKRLITGTFCNLTSMIGIPNLSEQFTPLFNTHDGLRLMIDDVQRDIRVDRQLLQLPHVPKGFNLIHSNYLNLDRFRLKKVNVEIKNGAFVINMNPYKFLHTIIPAMRRSVIAKAIKSQHGTHGGLYLGRFTTFVTNRIISERVRYSQLQKLLHEIHNELALTKPNKSRVRALAFDFVESFDEAQATTA